MLSGSFLLPLDGSDLLSSSSVVEALRLSKLIDLSGLLLEELSLLGSLSLGDLRGGEEESRGESVGEREVGRGKERKERTSSSSSRALSPAIASSWMALCLR